MVYFMIGNVETTQTCRMFYGETATDAMKMALGHLPAVIVKNGKFLADFGEDREDSKAWALLDAALATA